MENRMIDEAQVSRKNDRKDDKLRWELLPLEDIEDVVKVYTEGAKKYAPNSWQNLENGYERYKAALFRHLVEYEKGNEIDEETGCRHLAQVVWNAIAMLHISKHASNIMDAISSFYEGEKTETVKSFPDGPVTSSICNVTNIEECNESLKYVQ